MKHGKFEFEFDNKEVIPAKKTKVVMYKPTIRNLIQF